LLHDSVCRPDNLYAVTADRPTLAFLFTDVQGSTPLWEAHPVTMVRSRELHDELLQETITAHDGDVFGTAGDSFAATFTDPHQAVAAAIAIQQAFADAPWSPGPPLTVRIGIHVGDIEIRDGKRLGPTVNTAARVGDAGHGGQIVVSETVIEATGIDAVPLGVFRLKGVGEHMRLFQIGDGQFPALRAVDDRMTNLSPATNNLIGRSGDLHRLSALIDAHRLVTLTGVGGVGKTRLAEAAALRRMGAHSDGVWVADLSRASDASSVMSGVAACLNVPPAANFERLADLVRGHDLLLLLDNCEHVIDDVYELCAALLDHTSRLRIVATSREGVGLPGEHVMVVRPLSIDGGAPQLFVERAAQAGVDLDTEQHRAAVLDICERLDGIPLALELAAATSRRMSPRDIADRLDERFTLLRGTGRRGGIERHQTLRAAVDWSYSRLDPVQQQFLRRLGVFSGGVALDAAEAMATDLGEPAIQLLGDLVDRSLISVHEVESRSRYVLLETIRQYALDRLVDADETADVTRRHAEWCRDFARRTAAAAFGPAELVELRRLVSETANFRVALNWALESGNPELATDLLLALEDLAYISSSLAELIGPVVAAGAVDSHPEADRLLAMELIRRAMSDGGTDRVSLAQQLSATVSDASTGVTLMTVLLIGSALRVFHDASIAERIIARADRTEDRVEQARLLVAALIATAYIGEVEAFGPLLTRAGRAAEEAGMKRLSIAVGSMACLQGLRVGEPHRALTVAGPILDYLDDLPSPSIMSSGLIVMYTETALRADAPTSQLFAAVRRLRPVLHGDFDRLGLALARLVEQSGNLALAVRALGACTSKARSGFSVEQRSTILDHAVAVLGAAAVQQLLEEGRLQERSDLYREMWSHLLPAMISDRD
jgi:predicted ATPase/class 3 adenylate cyclase